MQGQVVNEPVVSNLTKTSIPDDYSTRFVISWLLLGAFLLSFLLIAS